MPVTRSARKAATRANTKRTILSALDENKPASTAELQLRANPKKPLETIHAKTTFSTSSTNTQSLPDINVLNPDSVHVLLDDIQRLVKAQQTNLSIKKDELVKNQHDVFFLQGMKVEKGIKKMTIRDFNKQYMNANTNAQGGNNKSGQKKNIIDVLKGLMISTPPTSSSLPKTTAYASAAKKRARGTAGVGMGAFETPARTHPKHFQRTPGTILRTARKGEVVFSVNGSPIDKSNEGDLVATVCKKRRGNGHGKNVNSGGDGIGEEKRGSTGSCGESGDGASFDINIGDGRYITLSDPSAMAHLTSEMKDTAKNQLNVLQDQLSKLLSHLNN